MTAPTPLPGHCLCGAVRFTATPERREMDVCHCSMCRRWGGGPAMTLFCFDLAIADEAKLTWFRSSDWAERGFCSVCGSSLFWRTLDRRATTISAQAFDAAGDFPFTTEIFIEDKPQNYTFANDTHKMTGAEVAEQLAALLREGPSGAG